MKMKKIRLDRKTLLIIIGVVLIIVGYSMLTRKQTVDYSNEVIISDKMSEEEATALIDKTLVDINNIYEKPEVIFTVEASEVEEDEEEDKEDKKEEKKEEKKDDKDAKKETKDENEIDGKLIKDYNEKIKQFYNADGIKEFEKMKFDKTTYVNKVAKEGNKKDVDVYFMNGVVSPDNYFSNDQYSISSLIIKEKKITCKVNYSRLRINELDEVSYEVYTKRLILEKDEETDNWLISSYNYANNYK